MVTVDSDKNPEIMPEVMGVESAVKNQLPWTDPGEKDIEKN